MEGKEVRKKCLTAMMCVLVCSACGQEARLQQENVAVLSVAEAAAKEVAQLTAEAEKAAEIPDISKAKDADEVLALLIKDEGFRTCIRNGIGFTAEDSPEQVLQKLESCESIVLKEASYGIYSLEALQFFPNLKRLVINISERDDSELADFTPIAQLSQLEEVYISYGKHEQIDLSFLGGMDSITGLFLTQCNIVDCSFLEQMPQLQCLSLYETPVEDLAVLEKLPELVELALSGNENAKHIESVGTLTKMQDLGIQYCGIEDIGFLGGLTELRGLNLNGNSVADITPLAGLTKLERLGLAGNKVSDISVLGDLSNLFDLALDGNEIQDISALAQLSHLNQVGLSDNQIKDLSPLEGKEELMYAAVSGNPLDSMEPVWEVPMLLYTDKGVSDEEKVFIAEWLGEHYPEVEEFESDDFVQGDLNNDGWQDIAFVVESAVFDVHEEDFPERMPDERRLFILLQQKDGSWAEMEEVPHIPDRRSGGMRGDPYHGAFMGAGYLLIEKGWGSSGGTVQTEIYEYRNGSLVPAKTISLNNYRFAEGYDVQVQNPQTDTWKSYAIAMDGYRRVRVDLADSGHPKHKAFPAISIYDMSYYIYREKVETQITSQEALDRVCAAAAKDGTRVVQEKLPYAEWQKEGYELLLGVALPEYYYILPETKREADTGQAEWEGDYLYYDGMIRKEGTLYHKIYLEQEHQKTEFLLDDATGIIADTE